MIDNQTSAPAIHERKGHTPGPYLLVKRGLYYAPNNQGYTGIKSQAGRYHEVCALGLDGVTAIHEDKAPMFSPACFHDVQVGYLTRVNAELLEALKALLAEARACGGSLSNGEVLGCAAITKAEG